MNTTLTVNTTHPDRPQAGVESIVRASIQARTLTLQQEDDLKALLRRCEPLTIETLEPVITLLEAITTNQVIPYPARICRIIPELS